MEGLLSSLGFASGLAIMAGFRAFFPLVFLGLLARFSPPFMLPPPFSLLSSTWVLLILLFFMVWELMSEKWPIVKLTENVAILPIRLLAGGVMAASVLSRPGGFWAFLLGILMAALGIWFNFHLRPAVSGFFQEKRVAVLSSFEDMLVIAGFVLLMLAPWLIYLLWGIIIYFFVKKIKAGNFSRPPRRILR